MLIQRGLAYLDIAGEEESVGTVLELTPNIRRVPFFMEEESKKQWEKTILLQSTLLPISNVLSLAFSETKTRILPPEDVNDYSRALTDAGLEHEFHRYDYAGHAFQSFNIEEKYSEDAWTKVLDFFRKKFEDSLIFRIKRGGGTWGWVHVTILSHLLAKKGDK